MLWSVMPNNCVLYHYRHVCTSISPDFHPILQKKKKFVCYQGEGTFYVHFHCQAGSIAFLQVHHNNYVILVLRCCCITWCLFWWGQGSHNDGGCVLWRRWEGTAQVLSDPLSTLLTHWGCCCAVLRFAWLQITSIYSPCFYLSQCDYFPGPSAAPKYIRKLNNLIRPNISSDH